MFHPQATATLLNVLGFEQCSDSHSKTNNDSAVAFVKQTEDSFQPQRMDLRPNFRTTFCESVPYLLALHDSTD
jgi:hypothetical protein